MKRINLVLLGIAVLLLIGCGGAQEKNSIEYKKAESTPLSEVKSSAAPEPGIRITGVEFGNAVDVENDITAEPILSEEDAVLDFSYRWFVNDNEIPGENGDTLSREYFKESDWVHCKARISSETDEYPEYLSKRIRILGAIPKILRTNSAGFTAPGIFRYQIRAVMPDLDDLNPEFGEEDEEENPEKSVKFELVSPLGKGVMLNSLTGEITWNITEELIRELGLNIEIKFRVISPSGRKVTSSITLNLEKGEADSPESEDISSLGTEIE